MADKCIRLREGRIGEDKVLDTVEESLMMEMENVRLWQMKLKTAIEQVGECRDYFLIWYSFGLD